MTKLYLFVRRYLAVMLVLGAASAFAQQSVSGKITSSDDGSGIPGVNVLEKGTTNGTVSDADGSYTINVGSGATLVFSFVGYTSQEVTVGSQTAVNITLQSDVTSLSEVVVVGYGSQDKKELTSAVVSLDSKDFNKGNVNTANELLQGKVAGLSIYNKGGDPNASPQIRLRGISTVGANSQPLVVIDGVIGASLDNVDPNDIESINVLKDGSGAAIYGSRGSTGVILVTTKRGSKKAGQVSVEYNGYVAASSILNQIPVMTASQYVANGGNDLGAKTDWQSLVTRTGVSNVHNLAISGGSQTTTFRLSANFRNQNGILKNSGYDQVNTRANLTHSALDNKLRFDVNIAFTTRNSNFSFNEALRYAALYNPTAPVRFANGDYYQAILFDNFNPLAIIDQNINEGKRKNLNYNAKIDYTIIEGLTLTANYSQQFYTNLNGSYYSRNSLFRGFNRGGLAGRYTNDYSFTLFEGYANYSKAFGKVTADVTGGYSYQEEVFQDFGVNAGNFPSDELGYNNLGVSGDRLPGGLVSSFDVYSSRSPNNKIIAMFGRLNLTFDNAIFLNASVRREGSTKFGSANRWGVFPAVGLGVDLNHYLKLDKVNLFKLRVGYGVTGSQPNDTGVSQGLYNYTFTGVPVGTVSPVRDANPNLKWEEKAETNVGVDFGMGKFSGTLDVYTRNVNGFILNNDKVDVTQFPSGNQVQNLGSLKTNGIELTLNYNAVEIGQVRWTPGIVLSSYKTTLESYIPGVKAQARAPIGAPGQSGVNQVRLAVGEEIGQIWGPVFAGVGTGGTVLFADLNKDGVVTVGDQTFLDPKSDYQKLGNGIPSMELGWTNRLTYKNWDLNLFFRGAFGHSLVNNFRAFYEPIDPGAINSYNRVITSKAVSGLTEAKYSSLYVEKADFLKLDNATLGYTVKLGPSSKFKNIRFYASAQNAFIITSYTGIDPEPSLSDLGASDNGGFQGQPDPLAPGIDRRNNYFNSRTFTFGLNIGL
jgi:TonB-dependent starch-binding outer membrane protein SusC